MARKEKRTISVRLSDAELLETAKNGARLSYEIADLKEEAAGVKKDYEGRIKVKELEKAEAERRVRTGHKDEEVECTWHVDTWSGVKVLRDPFGRELERRVMDDYDRQLSLQEEEEAYDRETEREAEDEREELYEAEPTDYDPETGEILERPDDAEEGECIAEGEHPDDATELPNE
jgi:hypothetical protein